MTTHQLEAGQYIRDGKLYGWTGRKCPKCQGYGEGIEAKACAACAGTGDEHGEIKTTPSPCGEPWLLGNDNEMNKILEAQDDTAK